MRSEESSKLIQGLKTNIEYQIAMEKERASMLAEKGRLLDQLICREKLSQNELKRVKVSREVTREVDKILTPKGRKWVGFYYIKIMTIFYSLVAKDKDTILAEYTEHSGNFQQLTR